MGQGTRLVKSEGRVARNDAAAFLRELADKVEAGRVVLRRCGEELTLALPESLVLEIQADEEVKGARGMQRSLEIELEWREGEEGGPVELG
jgi:amphi-Trp domain-containing protein